MIERKVVLKNRTGLHARPASELVAFAKELPCRVYLEHNGKKAAADSIHIWYSRVCCCTSILECGICHTIDCIEVLFL